MSRISVSVVWTVSPSMSEFDQLVNDIRQGYNVIDLLPEEDGALFEKVSTDVKEGYCVVDLLDEDELSSNGRLGCDWGVRRQFGSFSCAQGREPVTRKVLGLCVLSCMGIGLRRREVCILG